MKKFIVLLLSATFPLLTMGQSSNPQKVSGKILDYLDEPLEGASIFIVASDPKDPNEGNGTAIKSTFSDAKGSFTLFFEPKEGMFYSLDVRYLGYSSQSIKLDGYSASLQINLEKDMQSLEGVTITGSIVADNKTPVANTTVTQADLRKLNFGQDLPVLLNPTPSLVYTTDAGAGVGYTSLRIRGSDQSRINVTLNGIPLNDPESHGVFWVNMPDFASSAQQIDIQRGAGTSTNGAGAFGANINIETFENKRLPSVEYSSSTGSFNTQKHKALVNTGDLIERFQFSGRVSHIKSDGYIDRASSDLSSYYLSGTYRSYDNNLRIDAIHFSGKERTYQAWYGTPYSRFTGDEEEMNAYADRNWLSSGQRKNLLESGVTYNFYEYPNETDNYQQDHFQLHGNYQLSPKVALNLSGFHVRGAGYYEQMRTNDRLSNYGIDPVVSGSDTITRSTIIRQRWLDNTFTGYVAAMQYKYDRLHITISNAYNEYYGDHFGEIHWSQVFLERNKPYPYYFNESVKKDLSSFIKVHYDVLRNLNVFADFQHRNVKYTGVGFDQNRRFFDFDMNLHFINPKAGINISPFKNHRLYGLVSVANREPVRRDFVDALTGVTPKHETLIDYEVGYQIKNRKIFIEANLFYMDYYNQLVPTGEINDVGGLVRRNVEQSYRRGIELQAQLKATQNLHIGGNVTLSQNQIQVYNDIAYDWITNEEFSFTYLNTPIAFSPQVMGAATVEYTHNQSSVMLIGKYVGDQFLDNSGSQSSLMPQYFVMDARASYLIALENVDIELGLLVNNIANQNYFSNGYTYMYALDGVFYNERMVYPQAGRNFLASISVRFH